jgi:hypothetical protein
MADEQSKTERRGPAPTRRRRARASDGDAEVNPPGEPSQRRAAPGWERRSKEMPGRQGTMQTAPWAEQGSLTTKREDRRADAEPEENPARKGRMKDAPWASSENAMSEAADDGDDFDDEDDDDVPGPGGPPGPRMRGESESR